jgi:hypothetical protein
MRAQKYLVLPDEDAAEFAYLEAALVEELAPVGALQIVPARRVAVAAWRLARAAHAENAPGRADGAADECSQEPTPTGTAPEIDHWFEVNETERYDQRRPEDLGQSHLPARGLHEAPGSWTPNEPDD